jgi:FKBP-type peptidyl-prolyl cis-trans isomerase FkpA
MQGFMIQGGGFTAEVDKKEQGLRPGIKNEWRNGLRNTRGTVAMARLGGNPDSATAQFFINVVDNASLDKPQRDGAAYAVFGKVVEGLDVVDAIRNTKVQTHPKYGGGRSKVVPVEPVIIEKITLIDAFDLDKFEALNAEALAETLKAETALAAKDAATQKAASSPVGKRRAEELVKAIAALEAEHGKKFTTTASGLMVMVIEEGSGPSPVATDKVKVHYRGTFPNGEEFDSSYKNGQPLTFGLNKVIKGWTEGVSMMQVGGKNMLICPPDLAYGSRGRPGMPANSTLIFQVELLGIE